MGFSFGNISTATTKAAAQQDLVENTVLLSGHDPNQEKIIILLDNWYNPDTLRKLKVFLKRNNIKHYEAIMATKNKIKDKDEIKGGIIKFYKANKSDWSKHLNPSGNTKIITVGSALYSVTDTDDIYPNYMYDIVFNRTYFWSPEHNAWVFPTDSLKELWQDPPQNSMYIDLSTFQTGVPVDTYKTHFTEYQLKQASLLDSKVKPWDSDLKQVIKIALPPEEDLEEFEKKLKRYNKTLPEYVITQDQAMVDSWLKSLLDSRLLSLDIETGGFNFVKDELGCLTASNDGETAYYIPWAMVSKRIFAAVIDTAVNIVGANFKFDIKFIRRNGVANIKSTQDTWALGHVLNEQRSNSLKTHAWLYTSLGGYDKALDAYKDKHKIESYLDIPLHILVVYAAQDAIVTWRSYKSMKKQINWIDETYPNEKNPEWPMLRYYEEIMMPANKTFVDIEYEGLRVNKERWRASRADLHQRIVDIERELAELLGVTPNFDFNSTEKLGDLLEERGYKDIGRSKKGKYLTNDDALEKWVSLGHTDLKKMQELRSVKTILKSFVSVSENSEKGWAPHLTYHEEDDSWRIHPGFGVMGTESGRGWCRNPNFQNPPAHGKYAKNVKKIMSVPDESKYRLATLDFASLQIRLATMDTNLNESGVDNTLLNIYTDPALGADLHSQTGWSIFAKGQDFEVDEYDITLDSGKVIHKLGGETIQTTNRGSILVRDLTEEDDLL